MDHKCRVHFTIISHFVDLDQILETDDVGNSFLNLNHTQNLYPGNLHFSEILRPLPLLFILRVFNAVFIEDDVNFLLQHRSKVDWLSIH